MPGEAIVEATESGPAPAHFSYHDINVVSFDGITPHLKVSLSIQDPGAMGYWNPMMYPLSLIPITKLFISYASNECVMCLRFQEYRTEA